MSIFKSENIISIEKIHDNLNIYYAGFDLGEFEYDRLVQQIQKAIVDFAFGFHDGILEDSYNIDILREASKSIYKIKSFQDAKETYIDKNSEYEDTVEDKYVKRGEFGELILHLLLRDFHDSLPLLSKIYFKDSDGHTVHGFDSVHIAPDIKDKNKFSLWLGESKLYNDGKAGVKALTKDIEEHFNKEYLRREFSLISKKKNGFIDMNKINNKNKEEEYNNFLEQKNYWYDKIDENNKLEDILNSVTIPMICTYSSNTFKKHMDEKTEDFLKDLKEEIKELEEHFSNNLKSPIPIDLNILLLFLPIPSKKELVSKLHTKLDHLQRI